MIVAVDSVHHPTGQARSGGVEVPLVEAVGAGD
jgi:hypothetical protein